MRIAKKDVRRFLQRAFYNHTTTTYRYVNDFFALLTIISIVGIVLETVASLQQYHRVFLVIEYVTVFLFVLEYIGRIMATRTPLKYIVSFFGMIDLFAILPTLAGLGNFTFLKSARILRIIRFLRMLRLAKIARIHGVADDHDAHSKEKFFALTVQIYFMTFMSAVTIGGALMWFVEGARDVFSNIPFAMLWSAKVLLGGTPQASPDTISGEIIVIFLRFVGLVLFGLLINIIGGGVKKLLFGDDLTK